MEPTYDEIIDLAARLGRWDCPKEWITYPTWVTPPRHGVHYLKIAARYRAWARDILMGKAAMPEYARDPLPEKRKAAPRPRRDGSTWKCHTEDTLRHLQAGECVWVPVADDPRQPACLYDVSCLDANGRPYKADEIPYDESDDDYLEEVPYYNRNDHWKRRMAERAARRAALGITRVTVPPPPKDCHRAVGLKPDRSDPMGLQDRYVLARPGGCSGEARDGAIGRSGEARDVAIGSESVSGHASTTAGPVAGHAVAAGSYAAGSFGEPQPGRISASGRHSEARLAAEAHYRPPSPRADATGPVPPPLEGRTRSENQPDRHAAVALPEEALPVRSGGRSDEARDSVIGSESASGHAPTTDGFVTGHAVAAGGCAADASRETHTGRDSATGRYSEVRLAGEAHCRPSSPRADATSPVPPPEAEGHAGSGSQPERHAAVPLPEEALPFQPGGRSNEEWNSIIWSESASGHTSTTGGPVAGHAVAAGSYAAGSFGEPHPGRASGRHSEARLAAEAHYRPPSTRADTASPVPPPEAVGAPVPGASRSSTPP